MKGRPAREEFVPGERNDKYTVVSGCPIAYKAGLNKIFCEAFEQKKK
jgi:hypothetical protein